MSEPAYDRAEQGTAASAPTPAAQPGVRGHLENRLRQSPLASREATKISFEDFANTNLSLDALDIAKNLGTRGISVPVLGGSVRLFDILIILASAGIALLTGPGAGSPTGIHALAAGLAVLFTLAFFQASDVYQVPVMRQRLAQIGRVSAGWTLVFAMFAVLRSATGIGSSVSDAWIGAWYSMGLVSLCISRLVLSRLVRGGSGSLERRAVIVGGGHGGGGTDPRSGTPSRTTTSAFAVSSTTGPTTARRRSSPAIRSSATSALSRRIRPRGPHRHADRLHSSARRKACAGAFEDAVGSAGRHSPVGTHRQGALPRPRILLHRHGALRRCREKPMATGIMVAKRAFDLVFASLMIVLLRR
jgi:hypothetical protein